ncbi:MAG: NAD(P)-dependent alcohol dehydrogenase [Chitinophagales bacterium]|nr:NAD(P)-dependent alcohol dehydrogenase [Chitinophagaceae bacterium]MCB9063542.1 NAD(P)-dependent alcohol dehydrogenase [Chitinophagales bacterium]
MKAVVVTKYGGPEVLQVQEVATPTPKENELLIKVHAACISRAGAMMRSGTPRMARLFLGLNKPKNDIPGACFAGVVAAMGSNVEGYEIGDAVFGEAGITFGTNAEYVAVKADGIVLPMPDHLSFEEAAIMCDGPLTSLNFLKNLGQVKPGQKVLINGASGSLGVAAVQLAKYMGAEVTGVCSGKNAELVKSLGADHVIDYTKEDFTTLDKKYDVIYDTLGIRKFSDAKPVLTDNGIFMSPVLNGNILLPMLGNKFRSKKAKFDATGMNPVKKLSEMLQDVTEFISNKDYNFVIERRYGMDEIVEAHRLVDTGRKRGNIVLSI